MKLIRTSALAALMTTAATGVAEADLGDRVLRSGDYGADVRELQSSLNELGHATSVDGAFGPRTRRSVKRYERAISITRDGRVSRKQGRGIERRVAKLDSPPAGGTTDSDVAVLAADGRTALAPESAPQEVKDAIAAANRITDKPYRYGGGHGRFRDSGYDCSGAISYALHGAGLLRSTRNSTGFMSYGRRGKGDWITVYANHGHAYIVIAGLRFDTSGRGEEGPRWRPEPRSGRRYEKRHPAGF